MCIYTSAQKAGSYKNKLTVNAIDLTDDSKELFDANLSELVEVGSTAKALKYEPLQDESYEPEEAGVQDDADTSEVVSLSATTPDGEKPAETPAGGPNFGAGAPVPPSDGGLGGSSGDAEPPHSAGGGGKKGSRKRPTSSGEPKQVLAPAPWLVVPPLSPRTLVSCANPSCSCPLCCTEAQEEGQGEHRQGEHVPGEHVPGEHAPGEHAPAALEL